MSEVSLPALWGLLGHSAFVNDTVTGPLLQVCSNGPAPQDGLFDTLSADRHHHAVLVHQLGLGSHEFVLPLLYSLLAGLSTGIGGLLCLLLRGNAAMEEPLTAFMLATAAAAMITVSIIDLFVHIAEEIGLEHTLFMSMCGAAVVVFAKKIGNYFFEGGKGEQTSETRLLRVGMLTAITLTAHNFPEGMAVALR